MAKVVYLVGFIYLVGFALALCFFIWWNSLEENAVYRRNEDLNARMFDICLCSAFWPLFAIVLFGIVLDAINSLKLATTKDGYSSRHMELQK